MFYNLFVLNIEKTILYRCYYSINVTDTVNESMANYCAHGFFK